MMTDRDLLIQRFLDQDLTADERVRFLRLLGEDGSLRRQVLMMERVLAEVPRLPVHHPPPDFIARLMARLPQAPTPSRFATLGAWLRVPRSLEWNMAGALATACLVVLVGSLTRQGIPTAPVPSVPSVRMATMAQSASVSDMTQQQSPVLVRFVFLNPGARSVALAGDFNGWSPIQTPLQRTGAGAWTATVTVKPGRYHYMFVVDGRQWLTDPSATEVTDDGFGAENAVLEVGTTF